MDVNVATPIHRDGQLAIFGTWGRGATLLRLNVRGNACTVEEVWRTSELDNEHGGVVLVGGYLYDTFAAQWAFRANALLLGLGAVLLLLLIREPGKPDT